jgi:hypothetical protein
MPRKTYRCEEIIAKLRQGEGLIGQGKKVPEVIKALGVHEVTHYRWRRGHGGLDVSQAKRLKGLERENARLRKAVSDLALDKVITQEAAERPLSPSRRRKCVELVCEKLAISERRDSRRRKTASGFTTT